MPRSFGKLDRKSRFIVCESLNTVDRLFLQWSDKIVKGFLLTIPHSCVLFSYWANMKPVYSCKMQKVFL